MNNSQIAHGFRSSTFCQNSPDWFWHNALNETNWELPATIKNEKHLRQVIEFLAGAINK
ncbi:MAG: hypothetical protein [Bacteriophage sp.]|nr:MAG: hypothetical protein [Bacteriophage sp.]